MHMPSLQFAKLNWNAQLPQANGDRAMALDLCACEDVNITPGDLPTLVNTGVVLHPDSYDYVAGMQLSLRSGFALKSGCIMANGVGLIESSFAGFERHGIVYGISCALIATHKQYRVEAGDRIAQLLVWNIDGELMSAYADLYAEWCLGADLYADRDYWHSELGPGAGGRSGFGSTGSKYLAYASDNARIRLAYKQAGALL
jgi:dUTPase